MSESLRGHYLIAGRRLRDPNFFKAAVLVLEHGGEGSMGLVINRPSSVTIAHALTGHLERPKTTDVVYVGGPVEPAALIMFHNSSELDPDETAVIPGVYLGSSPQVFEKIVCDDEPKANGFQYRVYCGYAGWAPGQLDEELARGDWLTIPAQADYVFHPDPYAVWDELRRNSLLARRLLSQHSDHPEWN